MKYAALVTIFKMAYKLILRDLLVGAIDNPDSEWDDMVLRAMDALFEYNQD